MIFSLISCIFQEKNQFLVDANFHELPATSWQLMKNHEKLMKTSNVHQIQQLC